MVDLQVNGFAGVDFNAADDAPALTADTLDIALEAMLATGVTCCLPTVITAPLEVLAHRLRTLDVAIAASRLGPLMCPGYHVEGPFLNPASGYAGCHPPAAMLVPDYEVIQALGARLQRPILMLTLAPELSGSIACIEAARRAGMLVAIGHSAAPSDTVIRAVSAGATLSTHLGNGLPPVMAKLDNPVFAQLSADDLCASFIADGIHVPTFALKAMMRAKGPGRAFLVTDATAAAAAPPGLYRFADLTVTRGADGSVRVPGALGLAGSALCLDAAVRNLVLWRIATPDTAIAMASTVPAAVLAPALDAADIILPQSTVDWWPELHPARVRVGSVERCFPNPCAEGSPTHG